MAKKLRKIKATAKNKKRTPEEEFNDALQRLERFEAQNTKFAHDIDTLEKNLLPKIRPLETQRIEAQLKLAEKLSAFIDKKSLAQFLRDELDDWILDLREEIAQNPFVEPVDISQLDNQIEMKWKAHERNEMSKQINSFKKAGASDEDIADMQEFMDQMHTVRTEEERLAAIQNIFKQLDDYARNDEDNADGAPADFMDDLFGFEEGLFGSEQTQQNSEQYYFSEEDEIDDPSARQEAELKKLLSSTSINKLFRRIAKVIHPDLEQDPTEKHIKHTLMSELIIARDNKDIATILKMYCQHFGDLPSSFPESDYPKLIKLINYQIEKVKHSKLNCLQSSYVKAILYEWFYANSSAEQNRLYASYEKSVKNLIKQHHHIVSSISSIKTLRPFLESRRTSFF